MEYLKYVNYLIETILMIVHIVVLVFWTPSQRKLLEDAVYIMSLTSTFCIARLLIIGVSKF